MPEPYKRKIVPKTLFIKIFLKILWQGLFKLVHRKDPVITYHKFLDTVFVISRIILYPYFVGLPRPLERGTRLSIDYDTVFRAPPLFLRRPLLPSVKGNQDLKRLPRDLL
jgi:hypothetical protein